MNDPKLDPLLNELLSGEEARDCRADSLEQMLTCVRRHQHQRQSRRVAVLAAVPALLALAWFASRWPAPEAQLAANINPPSPAATPHVAQAAAPAPETVPVRFISDDELLDLFPGRPVALIGAPGRQRFVFLGQ